MINTFAQKIKTNPRLKQTVLNLMMHPVKTRPRFWLRCLQFFFIKKGKGSVIYRSVRRDIVPFDCFELGKHSIIEDYSIVNNAVGDIIIGDNSRVGLSNTIIGPVKIGNNVNLAQNVLVSGLNHNFDDVEKTIAEQGVSTSEIEIADDVWIGGNSVIMAGVKIGKHAVVGAGSIVTKDIPPFSVAVGNPAKVVKRYDFERREWKTV